MRIINDDLWNSKDNIILVTTNSYINVHKELVMGRGAALQLKQKYPNLPTGFGTLISNKCGHLGEYNVLFITMLGYESKDYGIFQVKYHYGNPADLGLIKRSVDYLIPIANYVNVHGGRISMNFPGIGWGGLPIEKVMPVIKKLPDNVSIYKKD